MNSLTTESKTHKLDVSKFSKDKQYVYVTQKEADKLIHEINNLKLDFIIINGESYTRSNIGSITKLTSADREHLNTQYGSEVYWYTDELIEGKHATGNTVYNRTRYEVTPRRKSEGGSSKKVISVKYCYYDENYKRVYCEKSDIRNIPCCPAKKLKDLKDSFGVQS